MLRHTPTFPEHLNSMSFLAVPLDAWHVFLKNTQAHIAVLIIRKSKSKVHGVAFLEIVHVLRIVYNVRHIVWKDRERASLAALNVLCRRVKPMFAQLLECWGDVMLTKERKRLREDGCHPRNLRVLRHLFDVWYFNLLKRL